MIGNSSLELPAQKQRRPLGGSGIEVSAIAWGTMRLGGNDIDAASKLLFAALDAGIDLIDTADIYGFRQDSTFGASETLLGRLTAADLGLRRRRILATKGGIVKGVPYDSGAAHISSAIDASLVRLRTDWIDLWQIHRPDILTHPAEIARAVGDAHKAGKIRAFGVSNFTVTQIAMLLEFLDVPIVSTQPQLSPLQLTPIGCGALDQAIAMDLGVLAWSTAWRRPHCRSCHGARKSGRIGSRRGSGEFRSITHGGGSQLGDGASRPPHSNRRFATSRTHRRCHGCTQDSLDSCRLVHGIHGFQR